MGSTTAPTMITLTDSTENAPLLETALAVVPVTPGAETEALIRAEAPEALPESSLPLVEVRQAWQQEVEALQAERQQLQTELLVQRASAAQSYRVAACLRQTYTALLEQTTQPLFIQDAEGRITFWNAALAHWLNIPAEEALGRNMETLFPAETPNLRWPRVCLSEPDTASHDLAPDGVRVLPGPITLPPGRTALRLLQIPLYRVPGCLEAVLTLMEPAP